MSHRAPAIGYSLPEDYTSSFEDRVLPQGFQGLLSELAQGTGWQLDGAVLRNVGQLCRINSEA